MLSLQTLLGRSLRLCNALGVPLATGVAAAGLALIALQTLLSVRMGGELVRQAEALVGTERFAALQEEIADADGTAEINQLLLDEINLAFEEIPVEARGAKLIDMVFDSFRRIAPAAVPLLLLLLLTHLLARAYFLILPARKTAAVPEAFTAAAQRFLPVAGAWIGAWLAAGAWVPLAVFLLGFVWTEVLYLALPSFIPLIVLYPRLVFAPVIAAEGAGVREALRESFRCTRERWRHVVVLLLGAYVTVWIVSTFAHLLLQLLIDAVLSRSPLGLMLYWIVPFLALIALAYRSAFTVLLSDALRGPARA